MSLIDKIKEQKFKNGEFNEDELNLILELINGSTFKGDLTELVFSLKIKTDNKLIQLKHNILN